MADLQQLREKIRRRTLTGDDIRFRRDLADGGIELEMVLTRDEIATLQAAADRAGVPVQQLVVNISLQRPDNYKSDLSTKLKPCPWCGGAATIRKVQFGTDRAFEGFVAYCVAGSAPNPEMCGIAPYSIPLVSAEAAAAAWNGRKS
jgi:hypothetical protein